MHSPHRAATAARNTDALRRRMWSMEKRRRSLPVADDVPLSRRGHGSRCRAHGRRRSNRDGGRRRVAVVRRRNGADRTVLAMVFVVIVVVVVDVDMLRGDAPAHQRQRGEGACERLPAPPAHWHTRHRRLDIAMRRQRHGDAPHDSGEAWFFVLMGAGATTGSPSSAAPNLPLAASPVKRGLHSCAAWCRAFRRFGARHQRALLLQFATSGADCASIQENAYECHH